ncbi:50S ribosomal protein L4 [Candidatus Saccharibacteria bacterium]|nr:50S ribosomal protein L4 [Candidatus Saccharibacteria bacterium]
MSVATFTKTGAKATTPAKLDKQVFGVEVSNHDLLQSAYLAYLANGRVNLAKTLKRGEVRGGGRKPWRQKGTGRARFGSIRNPIWRGGGVVFGPEGKENYSRKLSTESKRLALRQALSLAADSIKVIEAFEPKDAKTKSAVAILDKIGAQRNVLLIVDAKSDEIVRSTQNLGNVIVTQAMYVNVYDVMNADSIVITKKALELVQAWLSGAPTKPASKETA